MARWRKPTDEERRLWLRVTDTVDPLPGRRHSVSRPTAQPPDPKPSPAPARVSKKPSSPSKPTKLPYLTTGQTPSIDRRTADRLRKGRMEVQARLDLHGMSEANAHMALNAFLTRAQADGRRTVLVITGKGLFSHGRGVLRERLGDWLNMPPIRDKVLSFTQAQPRHGGDGAFYVLLKRLRETGAKGK
ncbi:MAG: Smr/MutS family protein [Pseudomonadota bacterium]